MIKQTYKDLAKYQLLSVKLDTVYNEKNEAAFIMQGYTEWQELKPKVYSLIEKLEQGPDEETAGLKNGYFG